MTPSTKKEEIKKRIYNDTISDEDFPLIREDDPFVIKKTELYRKSLEKAPFPEELLNRYKRNS